MVQSKKLETWLWVSVHLMIASAALGQGDDRLVGIWSTDDGFEIVELLFRSDGRYQLDTKSADPVFGYASTERGRYEVDGPSLALTPYDYLAEPQSRLYEFQFAGSSLSLTRLDFPLSGGDRRGVDRASAHCPAGPERRSNPNR
jgi:hypothetical protein